MQIKINIFFFSSRRRHTRCGRDWSSDVCSSDLAKIVPSLPPINPEPRMPIRIVISPCYLARDLVFGGRPGEIGRASCRERAKMPKKANIKKYNKTTLIKMNHSKE